MTDITILDKILGNEVDIQNAYFELAKIYYPTVLPDTLKSGLFGYVTEILTHATKQSIFHNNILFNEYFFNTSSFPSSIYSKAIDYDIPLENAKPSKAVIRLLLNLNDIDKLKDTNNIYRLNRNTTKFVLGDFIFCLPYDIKIHVTSPDSVTLNATAQYDIINNQSITAEIESVYSQNPYITSVIIVDNNITYLDMGLSIYQVEIQEDIVEISSLKLLDQVSFNIDHDTQFVNFYSIYTVGNVDYNLTKHISDYNVASDETKYLFYNYLDENSYKVYFTPTGFTPAFNSKVTTYTFTSKGSMGNFKYNKNIGVILDDKINYSTELLLEPTGGADRNSLKEMKKQIFTAIKQSATLNTVADLEDFFNNLLTNNFSSGSLSRFIKTQDDILKREYSVYLMMMDENLVPYSTNTIDLTVPNTVTSINNQDEIYYHAFENVYNLVSTGASDYQFRSPFMIVIESSSSGGSLSYNARYYNNFVDLTHNIYLDMIEESIDKRYLIQNLRFERDSTMTNVCDISCNLITDLTGSDITTFPSQYDSQLYYRLSFINLIVIFYDDLSDLPLGYIKLTFNQTASLLDSKKYNVYTHAGINISDIFLNNEVKSINTFKDVSTGLLINNLYLPEKISCKLVVADSMPTTIPSTIDLDNDLVVKNILELSEFSGFRFVSSLKSNNYFSLFNSLNYITNSTVITEDDNIKIKKIPVFSLDTYAYKARKKTFIDKFLNYSNSLLENMQSLPNNVSINVKFFNNYGRSNFYNTHTNINDQNNVIDVSLGFTIKLNTLYTLELDRKLKKFISDYVANVNTQLDKVLNKSNLVTAIENNFLEVSYVIFSSINHDTSITEISYKYTQQEIENSNLVFYPPEYLSIGYNRTLHLDKPKINITYK